MKRIFTSFLIVLLTSLCSCNLFQTRTPEEPNENSSNFPPATTPQTLVDNFTKSINQKNIAIYQNCLIQNISLFKFYPSADAFSIYSNIFQNWNLNSEITFARNLFSKFSNEESPEFIVNNPSFSSYSTDSTVFVADYELVINSKDNSINNSYQGTMQLVLVLDNSGLWKIVKWFDFRKQTESFQTISFLKAKLNS
ncbi:MAG: hypothetical protein CH6_2949 [Candidatus Kapaibacterium sp.]|nr:MAG: hypothetical protein CH6_2949 [Candidatus Kapabacteria bacterium]